MSSLSRSRSRTSIRRESQSSKSNDLLQVIKDVPKQSSSMPVPFDLANFRNFAAKNLQRELSLQSIFTRASSSRDFSRSETSDACTECLRWGSGNQILTMNQQNADRALIAILKKCPKDVDEDAPSVLAILQEIHSIKHIRGHEAAIKVVLDMLLQRNWKIRLEAMQILPNLVFKGDSTAIAAACGRLHDWHADVRRAAISSLRDDPGDSCTCKTVGGFDITFTGTLSLKVIQAKDLAIQQKYARVFCEIDLFIPTASDATKSFHFATSKALYSNDRVHWDETAHFVVAEIKKALCFIKIQQENDLSSDAIQLGFCQLNLSGFESEEPQSSEWIRLGKDNDSNRFGSILIQGQFVQGPGMGRKGMVNKTLTQVVPSVFDQDLFVRREATIVLSQHIDAANLDFTRLLADQLLDPSSLIRWTAVGALKTQLSTMDRNCCYIAVQASVRSLKSPHDDVRACAMEILYTAGPGLEEDWTSADGRSLMDIVAECIRDTCWLVRRGALKILSTLAPRGDQTLLRMITPFLDDDSFYVRYAACQVISVISERSFHLEGDPSDKDVDLANTIAGGIDHMALRSSGIKFNLLYELGLCAPHRADWSAKDHATWSHMKEWIAIAVAKTNERNATQSYLTNNLIRRARSSLCVDQQALPLLLQMSSTLETSTEPQIPIEQTMQSSIKSEEALISAAIEMAKKDAACAIQCAWRRKLAKRALFREHMKRREMLLRPVTGSSDGKKSHSPGSPPRHRRRKSSIVLAPEEFSEFTHFGKKTVIIYEKEQLSRLPHERNIPLKKAVTHGVHVVPEPTNILKIHHEQDSQKKLSRTSKVDYLLSTKFPDISTKLNLTSPIQHHTTSVPALDQSRVALLRRRIMRTRM